MHEFVRQKHRGGSIEIESGSSQHMGAGDITLKTGIGSSSEVGGNINIVASTSVLRENNYKFNYYDDASVLSKEINFGFDEVSYDSTTQRQISLQLKKSKNSTRLVSTVPVQVTTVQYLSDERIKKDITNVNTGDLLDRMRQIQLREYGESTNESSFVLNVQPSSSNFLVKTN